MTTARFVLAAGFAAAILPFVATAQGLPARDSTLLLTGAPPADFHGKGAWRFPIHTQAADPVGGEYGTWASTHSYKASFHDGFAFYPILGGRYPENLPLIWRNTKVTVGSHPVIAEGETPQHVRADWRYEYRYANLTEAYDVLDGGVEQTFVLARRPAGTGDLVVRGDVTTKLRSERVEAAHASLAFKDHLGNTIVEYGAATAIDAAGNRYPMTTAWDGDAISLRLPAEALASAVFPLTVDPLTSVSTIATATAGSDVQEPEIGRDDKASSKNILFAYSRLASASDYDSYVRITDNDYGNTTIIYTDLTTSWSTRNNQVAFVGGTADKWIVVFQRDFPSGPSSGVRYIVSPSGSTATISTYYSPADPTGYQTARFPDVGGLFSGAGNGASALIVCQCDNSATNANTANTEVFGRIIDLSAASPTTGSAFRLSSTSAGTTYDREYPSCTQVKLNGTNSWIVCWQQFDNTITNDDWDIMASRITSAGTVAGSVTLANSSAVDHALTPRVEGNNGRYMVTYATVVNTNTKYSGSTGSALECQRFDWSESAASPVSKVIRNLAPSGSLLSYTTGNIAYDTDTDSHWAITYVRRQLVGLSIRSSVIVERVGYSGGTVEAQTVYSNASYSGYGPSVTFDDDLDEFKICFATSDAGETLYARSLTYASNAVWATYGTACGPATIQANRVPRAGDEYFAVSLSGAPASQPAALLLSAASASISLAFMQMPGCWLNVNPNPGVYATSINALTNGAGAASIGLPLVDYPSVALGNVYLQWAYLSPGANPIGLRTTGGLVVSVR